MLHGWGSPRKARVFEKLIAGLPPVVTIYLLKTDHRKIWRSPQKGATGDGGGGARPADARSDGWSEEAAVGSQSRSRKEPRKRLGV